MLIGTKKIHIYPHYDRHLKHRETCHYLQSRRICDGRVKLSASHGFKLSVVTRTLYFRRLLSIWSVAQCGTSKKRCKETGCADSIRTCWSGSYSHGDGRENVCTWWVSVKFAKFPKDFSIERVPSTTTVRELKELFEKKYPAFYPERQAFFLDKTRSAELSNSDTLAAQGLTNECQLLFHDLGSASELHFQTRHVRR